MKEPRSIGQLINYNRKKNRMSQHEVAKLSGIPRQRLSRLENDYETPTIAEASTMADIFKDVRIIQAICSLCLSHQSLLNIAAKETMPLQPFSDLQTVAEHFINPMRESCSRIMDLATFIKDQSGQHEKRLLIIEETKRIRFLAEAMGLLTAHMG